MSSFFDHTSWFDHQTASTSIRIEVKKSAQIFSCRSTGKKTRIKRENSIRKRFASIGYVSLCTCLIGIDDGQIRSSIIKSNVNRNSSMNMMKNWLGRASTSKSMLVITTQRIFSLSLSRLFSLIFLWPWRVWINEEKKQHFQVEQIFSLLFIERKISACSTIWSKEQKKETCWRFPMKSSHVDQCRFCPVFLSSCLEFLLMCFRSDLLPISHQRRSLPFYRKTNWVDRCQVSSKIFSNGNERRKRKRFFFDYDFQENKIKSSMIHRLSFHFVFSSHRKRIFF